MSELAERYINLFADYGFKRIFGEEINKDLLLDFLNELLKEEQGQIIDLTYYTIAILGFVFDSDKMEPNKFRYDVKLTDTETKKIFYDKLTFIYLEMPKFSKVVDELENRSFFFYNSTSEGTLR